MRRIEGLAAWNRQVAHGVATVADQRVHPTLRVRPADRRAEDVAACTAWLAAHRFWYGQAIVRPVYPDG